MKPIRVMVVDDTIVYRKIVSDVLSDLPGVEVVGTANNGKIALSKIASLKPDLITLDIEMPELDGIEVLQALKNHPHVPVVVMLSTLTQQGSEMTIKALELGAFDFIPKPDQGGMAENKQKIETAVLPIIDALKRRANTTAKPLKRISSPPPPRPAAQKTPYRVPLETPFRSRSEIVGIGISTGGPNALTRMIPMLPENLDAAILIVQHMPPLFTESLAKSLNRKSALDIKEARSGDKIEAGKVFIAPGGKQMKIIKAVDGTTKRIKITDDPPENSCKPSADYLFRSIAEHYPGTATGVIMTGMGSDGSKGLAQMKTSGSFIIAQNEETCTVYGMPKVPVESDIADRVLPLDKIAGQIVETTIR